MSDFISVWERNQNLHFTPASYPIPLDQIRVQGPARPVRCHLPAKTGGQFEPNEGKRTRKRVTPREEKKNCLKKKDMPFIGKREDAMWLKKKIDKR